MSNNSPVKTPVNNMSLNASQNYMKSPNLTIKSPIPNVNDTTLNLGESLNDRVNVTNINIDSAQPVI